MRRWKRILVWSLAALALYTVLGFWALPMLARGQLEDLLAEALDRPARIERITFNPFTLKAAVEGLEIGARQPEAPALAAFRRLELDLAWRSLIEWAPVVQRLTLSGPQLHLVREAEGRYDIDDLIAKWSGQPAEPDAPPARFALANIVIEEGSLIFDDRVLPRTHRVTGLTLQLPFLSSLPVHQQIDVEPRLAAQIEGSALGIEGRSRPFAETHESALDLSIAPLDLAPYLGYLPAAVPVKPVSGVIEGALRVEFAQPPDGAPSVIVSGQASLTDLALQDPAGRPLVSVAEVRAEGLRLEPLAKGYALEQLRVEAPKLTVHRRGDEVRFFERVLAALPVASEARPGAAADAAGGTGAAAAAPAVQGLDAPTQAPVAAPQAPGAATQATAAGPSDTALRWSIAELQIAGGEIDFLDERFSPKPLAVQASGLEVRLQGLDSTPGAPVRYTLGTALASGERLDAEGTATLAPLSVEGTATLDAVNLKTWWWIAQPQLQAELLEGRLSLQTGYRFAADGPQAGVQLSALGAQLDGLRLAQRWNRKEVLRVDGLRLADTTVDLNARVLQLGRIEGQGGRVEIVRDRAGGINLQRLGQPEAQASAPSSAAPSSSGSSSAGSSSAGSSSAESHSGAGAAPSSDAPAWRVALGKLALQRWEAAWSDAAAGREGDVRLSQLSVSAEGFDTGSKAPGRLAIKTRVGRNGSLDVAGTLGLEPLAGRLRIDARRIGILPAQPWFTGAVAAIVSSGELGLLGDLDFAVPAAAPLRAHWRGDVRLGEFAAATKSAGEELLRWKLVQAKGLDVVLTPLKVDMTELALSGFYARLVISPEGRFNLQDLVGADAGAQDGEAAKGDAAKGDAAKGDAAKGDASRRPGAAAPLPVRIGKILLNDGSVYFTDNFVRPNYSASLTELSGSVGTITPEAPGDVELRGKVAGSGSLEIVGSVNPLAPSLFLDLKANARDIELPPTSPYTLKYLGHGIERGKLSAQLAYRLEDRRLEAQNKVVLDQLTFGERVDSPTATNLPVLFAVALLKDRNGVIDIDMPVGGSLDDPQFSIGGLVLRMIFNLITKVVTAPFSVLAGLGGGGGDASQVAFPAGSAVLAPEAVERLKRLAGALADRPALRLDLAGRADPQTDEPALLRQALERRVKAEKQRAQSRSGDDALALDQITLTPEEYPRLLKAAYRRAPFDKPRNAIGMVKDVPVEEMEQRLLAHLSLEQDALRTLADQRAQAVRDWLRANGVAAERLFVVAPKLDREGLGDKDSATGVDLSLK